MLTIKLYPKNCPSGILIQNIITSLKKICNFKTHFERMEQECPDIFMVFLTSTKMPKCCHDLRDV